MPSALPRLDSARGRREADRTRRRCWLPLVGLRRAGLGLLGVHMPSDLELRPQRVRLDAARAKVLHFYSEAVKEGRARPPSLPSQPPAPVEATVPLAPARYSLVCIGCGRTIPLHPP